MIYGSAIASFCVEDFSLDRFRTLQRAEVVQRCRSSPTWCGSRRSCCEPPSL